MEFLIHNLDEIGVVAQQFIQAIGNHKILAFHGSMGAGKTTFIKALCEKLGVKNSINSPTFAIVNEYESATTGDIIYHFDFYRINRSEEALDFGYDDYVYSGNLCLMEWPENIATLLPDDVIDVTIVEQPDSSRLITIQL